MSIRLNSFKKIVSAAMVAMGLFAGNAFSQQEDARIPFVVNVNATVSASRGSDEITMSVVGGVEQVMTIPAGMLVSVRHGAANRLPNVANLRVDSRGNLNLSLPQNDYHSATITLYSVNGRRVMHTNVNETTRNFSRSNFATGIYIMSVKGVNGNSFTTRFNHRGGAMNINVSYSAVSNSNLRRETAAFLTSGEEWNIRVRATGYVDSVYMLAIVSGDNPRQDITLRGSSGGDASCPTSARELTANTWVNGNIPASGTREEWFRFTADTSAWHIHFIPGETTPSLFDINIQLYNSACAEVDSINLYSLGFGDVRNSSASRSVTIGQTYYIKITPYFSSDRGAYRIAFNASAIRPNASIVAPFQFNPNVTYGSLYDSRDGRTYRTVVMPDGKTWMAENLNYKISTPTMTACWCYGTTNPNNNPPDCDAYGRLYQWTTAMGFTSSCNNAYCATLIQSPHRGICPEGWHLPSSAEWVALYNAVGPNAAIKLRSRAFGNSTNEYGFSALPGGYRLNNNFLEMWDTGRWWTATEAQSFPFLASYVIIGAESQNLSCCNDDSKPLAFSVRCVKD